MSPWQALSSVLNVCGEPMHQFRRMVVGVMVLVVEMVGKRKGRCTWAERVWNEG